MPVHIRKYWIHKYNAENKDSIESTPNTSTVSGMNLNTYASLEQMKLKNSK